MEHKECYDCRRAYPHMCAEHRAAHDTELVRANNAGSYAAAYKTEDYAVAIGHCAESAEYRAAFILGFFDTYEFHQIPEEHREEYVEAAASPVGRRLAELGYLVRCTL